MSERVTGLVLCCSFVRNPLPALSSLSGLIDSLPLARIPVTLLSFFLLGGYSSAALRAALAAGLTKVAPEVMRARMRAVLSVDVSEKLSRLSIPLLYLRAKHDRVVPHAAGELIMTLLPSARMETLEAPHFLLQTAPREAARLVAEFLQSVRDSGHDARQN